MAEWVSDTLPAVPARQAVRLARPLLAHDSSDSDMSGNLDYRVLYNAHGLLSLEFEANLKGQPISRVHHATFDLCTGRPVSVAALLTQPNAFERYWLRQRRERFMEQVREIAREMRHDAPMKAQLQAELGWDAATHSLAGASLEVTDFALTRQGLVLFEDYVAQFPRPYNYLAPQGDYVFTYAELRPWRGQQGPWRSPPGPPNKTTGSGRS